MVSLSLSVGMAICLMQFLRVVHPPAGANPIVIMVAGKEIIGFDFLITPVLSGSIVLVVVAMLVNNLGKKNSWPVYWHGITRKKKIIN